MVNFDVTDDGHLRVRCLGSRSGLHCSELKTWDGCQRFMDDIVAGEGRSITGVIEGADSGH